MKHIDKYSTTPWYDPKPETVKARAALDKILAGTGFNHRTKGLWAYYRGNESARKVKTVVELYTLSLAMNGALAQRLNKCRRCRTDKCRRCTLVDSCAECRVSSCDGCSYKQTDPQRYFRESIKPTTIARWRYAMDLIDIANGNWENPDDLKVALAYFSKPQPQLSLVGRIKAAWRILWHGQ